MSININWENLTGGEDGAALAETIRAFIHDRFQQVPLPKMIRSVQVHSFDFGTVAPELELKDVSDPLSDFYDDAGDDTPSDYEKSSSPDERFEQSTPVSPTQIADENVSTPAQLASDATNPRRRSAPTAAPAGQPAEHSQSPSDFNPFLSRSSTPGIPGGTSNLSYFHQPLSTGLSGAAMPFAAVAGVAQHLPHGRLEMHPSSSSHRAEHSTPPSTTANQTSSAPPAPRRPSAPPQRFDTTLDKISEDGAQAEHSPDDIQIVMRLKYAGDVSVTLTADILLDYPMPSFVGIPLQLKVTGVRFDGCAILAYIRSKAHFCFLAPEDADALVGREETTIPAAGEEGAAGVEQTAEELHADGAGREGDAGAGVGGLFEMIKVESEIGQKASGKQVLKNVGKVEKFILEQVRQIFETEFVYPSFWTFLV